jgi:cytochrome c peroxidase
MSIRLVLLFLVSVFVTYAQPSQVGQWTSLLNWPFIPVSVAHLADGRLVAWASTRPTAFPAGETFSYAAVYDPVTGQITPLNNTAHDMFCAGLASTGDGRIIASGGGADVRTTSTFPITSRQPQTWSRLSDMLARRWYNSSITLPTGNLLTMWGRSAGTLTETFDQTTNTWSALSGISLLSTSEPNDGVDDDNQWFPHLHLMPNGKILMAGPLRTMHWLDYTGVGSAQALGNRAIDGDRHRKLGASVQYLPGKILFTGGRDDRYSPRVWNSAIVIDASSGTPVTTATNNMQYARAFHNLVVLPNGEVMALGGTTQGTKFNDSGGVTIPEIWNPATGQWRPMSAAAVPRGYHLVAILLRDGRVLLGGGGLCDCAADHRDSQIFSPPYLFNANGTPATRPVIDLAAADLKPGQTFGLKGSDNITGFRLIRLQATTHGINSDQRYIPVNHTRISAGNYDLTLDSNQSVLPPGMYWLFALTASGTPSIGYPVQIHTPTTWPGGVAGETNLAKGKPATQSSTEAPAAASRAVDNNTNGDFQQNSVSATAIQAQPFWQVDLGASAFLSSVRLWNRTDCCANQLSNFHVFVSDQPFTGTTVAQSQAQPGVLDLVNPGVAGTTTTLAVNRAGRYIRVQLEGNTSLRLAEVEVFGSVVTNFPPEVSLLSPGNGATFTGPLSLNLTASAFDPESSLARVEFFAGTTKLGEDTTAPYSFGWNNAPVGSHTLTARAFDTAGLSATSTPVNITINPPPVVNNPPTVSFTAPVNGATFVAPAGVSFTISATDPDNNLARVEFYNGATKLAERTTAPFTFNANDLGAGTYSFRARAIDAAGLFTEATRTVRVLTRQLQSLKNVPVPEPSQLAAFVKNRAAVVALGKALFWDTQLSSDGTIACASCHFHAGADSRIKSQANPGTFRTGSPAMTFDTSRTGSPHGPNYTLKRGDFPLHVLSNPNDPNSTIVYQSKDVIGSHGVFFRQFSATGAAPAEDACISTSDPVFGAFRRSSGRNTPPTINAVFNVRNFWDGRANSVFNGVDSFGPRNTTAVIYRGNPPAPVSIALDNASLASQALTPGVMAGEMSCNGRTWPEVGRRLSGATPLARQSVLSTDSALGTFAAPGGQGLTGTYAQMIQAAFQDDLHTSATPVTINGRPYSQLQANFSLFFGLALQLYQSTLVSDQAPIDNYFAPYPSTAVANANALDPAAVVGMNVFNGKGRCVTCHHGPQLTNAATPAREASAIGALVSHMFNRSGDPAAYDLGYYNIGVRPANEDLGVGGIDPFGNPLSLTRQVKSGNRKDTFTTDACTFEVNPCVPLNSTTRDAVDGAFKTPTLRNIALTGPYFHNGSAATLEEVVEFYNRGGNATGTPTADSSGFGVNPSNLHTDIRPLGLAEFEKTALVAFMKLALTDDRVLYERAPFDHPSLPLVHGQDGPQPDLLLIPAVGGAGRTQPLPTFEEILNTGDVGYSPAPTISLTAPAGPVAAPATVLLTATTTGAVAQVEFYNGTTLLGTDTTAPYSHNWANVPAGSYSVTARAVAPGGYSVVTSPVTVTVGAAPAVTLTAPVAPLAAPATVNLSATATGSVTQVEFLNGSTVLSTDTTAPYTFTWANVPAGSYTITARATATNGLTATSAPVTVTVDTAPTVSVSTPSVLLAAPAAIELTAAATGTLTQVEFFNGTELLSTDTTAPYAFTWPNVPVGSYTLSARATTATGLTATSSPITVTVATAPTVSLNAPTGALAAPATVQLSATTTGTLTQVEFYNGTALLFTDTSAPYAFTWSNVAAGSYQVTARAVATNGLSTTTAPNTVTVGAAPTISLSAPSGSLIAPATVELTAATTGTVTQVEFYNGTSLLFTDSTAPYAFTWTNLGAGAYSVTARAVAANGLTATSASVSITVGAAPVAPTITLTGPTGPLTAPAAIALSATTTGALTQVEFYQGTTLLSTDTTAPYAFSWTNVAAGSYTVTARALATNGLATVSAPLTLTVSPAAGGGPVPIAYWPLDSVTAGLTPDLASANNPVALSGGFNFVPGRVGQAIQFDPGSGAGNAQRSVLDPTKSYSVSLWVNLTNATGTQTFVSLPGKQVSNFYLQLAGWLHGGFAFDVYGTDSTSAQEAIAQSTTIPVPNRWYHLVAVHDAETKVVRLYVDGQREGETPIPFGTFANTNPIALGYSLYAASRHDGNDARLDDVRVFNTVLSDPEISALATGNPGTPAAPTIALTAPTSTLAAPATVTLTATTTGAINQVEFYNGTTLLFADTVAPYAFTWANVPVGTYTVTARAVAAAGVTVSSAPATVTVGAAPTISLAAPTTPLAAPATVTLAATTTGTIAQVEFYNGATLLFTDTTAPYAYTWPNVPAGSYNFTARAVSTNGLTATSAAATVTVGAAPTISLSAPASPLIAPASVSLTATTTGTLSQVEFYNGTTLLFTDTTAPYAYTWPNVPAGAYTLTARAVATNGLSATSAPATVTVGAPPTAPTITLTAPTGPLTAPATVALNATTTGTLSQVEFYNGTTLLFTDTTAPYAYSWPSVSAGSYTLTARAVASNGLTATSLPVTLTVNPTAGGGSPLIAHWPLDSVAAGLSPDLTSGSNALALSGGFTFVPGRVSQAIQFDPGSGAGNAQRTVLDPTKSYSVSLWVNLTAATGTQTFVSLPGKQVSNFYLQLAGWLHSGFAFDVYGGDSTSAPEAIAQSTTIPVPNRWYHLVAVHDAENKMVRLYVDGQREGEAPIPFGTFANTNPIALGYSIYAASRHDGNDARLDDVRVFSSVLSDAEVAALAAGNPGTPAAPTIALTAPAAPLVAPATINLSATTTGTISQVEFYNGTTLLFTDTVAPYAYTWTNVPTGTYTLTARAVAAGGITVTSAPATITVGAAPTIALTAPTTPLAAPATVNLSATTTGTITQVEFYNGTTLLFTDTTAPYAYTWPSVPAGSYTITARAVAAGGLTATSAPATVTVGAAPTVSLTAPSSTLAAPATVNLSATTTGTITQVEFYNGTTLLFTDTTAPYAYTWPNVPAGSYTVTARAVAANGLTATSAPATVTVGAAPTIILTAPTNALIAPATVNLSATTTGSISQVEFYNGTTLLFTDTTAPYAYTWSNVAAGSYSVTARAVAAGGLSATSTPATVTVGAAPIAPTVTLNAPSTTLVAPATVNLSATTTGVITQVEFYNGTTLLFTDTTAPYTHAWSNVAAGTYTVTARAVAAGGLSATSTPATVTVGPAATGPLLAAHWPFDAVNGTTSADASANNNAVALSGGFNLVPGRTGQAIQFNPDTGGGNSQRTVIDPTKSYSVSLWVNLSTTAGTQTFVSLPGTQVSSFYLQLAGWLHGGFVMDIYGADATSAPEALAQSTTIPVANRWYHLVAVHDAQAKVVRLFVNGQRESEVPVTFTNFTNTNPVALGYSIYAGSRHDGNDARLDDVRIFNSALTAAEAQALFSGQ